MHQTLGSFLNALNSSTSYTFPVLIFKGQRSPLFLTQFIDQVKKRFLINVTFISFAQAGREYVEQQLAISFLGNTVLYVITDLEVLSEKDKSKIFEFLSKYPGPHAVLLVNETDYSSDAQLQTVIEVQIPISVDQLVDGALQKFFELKTTPLAVLNVNTDRKISVDRWFLLLEYQLLAGRNIDSFKKDWLGRILIPEQSLFALSGAFFAKNSTVFFELWSAIQTEFQEPFWFSYWSNQLFKAYGFIVLMKAGDHIGAKKVGNRLPFSFLKTDWKRVSPDELRAAHEHLYQLDYRLKNGLGQDYLELFYGNYFSHYFQKG